MWNILPSRLFMIDVITHYLLFLMLFVIAEMVMIWKLNLLWNCPNDVLLIVICYFVTEMLNVCNPNIGFVIMDGLLVMMLMIIT